MSSVIFVQPFSVNGELAQQLPGRVVVLDVAFCADTHRATYASTTLPFIEALGDRLIFWIDHHEHERHIDFATDQRFVLSPRREHPATPEMITPELIERAKAMDTIVTHVDLDGIYAAAKFILGGVEPYPGADADARAADSRQGEMGPIAKLIDHAIKARELPSKDNTTHKMKSLVNEANIDDALQQTILRYLVSRLEDAAAEAEIKKRADAYKAVQNRTAKWISRYVVDDAVALVDIREETERLDLTQLLIAGQRLAPVAIVRYRNLRTGEPQMTIAAPSDSGYNFVKMFGLRGGMPTRVTLPDARFFEALSTLSEQRH
ncbi:MAG: hypothetical protein ACE5PV_02725 [Candidatus Poribacteria bacterium]